MPADIATAKALCSRTPGQGIILMPKLICQPARTFLALLLLTGACARLQVEDTKEMPHVIRQDDRILFLGDSITFAGGYVDHIEACLLTRYPDLRFELINLGLPSETVSGLSEAGHAGGEFPRPDLKERLERVLEAVQPDLVFASYGINCGIYKEYSEERFAAYRHGIINLIEAVTGRGARIVLMTPPPFATSSEQRQEPEQDSPRTATESTSGTGYDGVMAAYSKWILQLPEERNDVALAIDVRSAILPYQDHVYGEDPVHPNRLGHLLWGQAVLRALGVPDMVDEAVVQVAPRKVLSGQLKDLELRDGGVSFAWKTKTPLSMEDFASDATPALKEEVNGLNLHRLVVQGLEARRYDFWEGEKRLGEAPAEKLAEGIDLTDPQTSIHVRAISTNEHAQALMIQVGRRRALDFAMLQSIGHKRPMPGKILTEDEAASLKEERARMLEELRHPTTLRIRLVPIHEDAS